MRTKQFTLLCMAAFLSLVVLACDTQLGSPDGMPKVVGAESINAKEILVEFAEPAGSMADSVSSYVIRGPGSERLAVRNVAMAADRTSATLTTDAQQPDTDYTLEFGGGEFPVGTFESARVVGAVATNNTTVIVTFSRPMGLSARSEENYVIVQESLNAEAGVLIVVDAIFAHPLKDAVKLTTLPQNEVTYVLRVVNVRDSGDRPMAAPELLVDPSVATFRGMPASCSFVCRNGADGTDGEGACETDNDCLGADSCFVPGSLACLDTCACNLTDTDGDGLPDHVEQRGWVVTIELTNRDGIFDRRDTLSRDVTSDPRNPDTDGDGLSDLTERELASDPREPDTDGDGIPDAREFNLFFSSPVDQDTDEDQLDDFLEVSFYKTSPILADTDGDGLDDDVEVLELGRNPRLADLPKWDLDVGDLLLQIDERYTFVDETGQTVVELSSTSASFVESSETSKLEFNSQIDRDGWEFGVTVGAQLGSGSNLTFEASGKHFFNADVFTGSNTTTTNAFQEAYETSLSRGREFTTTRQVTREVFGASISAPLTIRSTGDIAFSITNLELSVLQLSPDRTSFTPIATLVPNSELLTGETTTINLGPLLGERGPINLGTLEVFPSLVENMLRAPRGPLVIPANFDITDEFGRNFAFTSQETNDRTATIVIDFGNGTVKTFHVAIAGAIDDKGFVGPVGEFVGGFDDEGRLKGIPLDYALQDILGLEKNRETPDAVFAGVDGIAQTQAHGDDVQVVPAGTTGLNDRTVIITAGDNDFLESIFGLSGDDETGVATGYATSATCSVFTLDRIVEPEDNGDGFANTEAAPGDVQEIPVGGVANPGETIISAGLNGFIDSVQAGDDQRRGPGDICSSDSQCPDNGDPKMCTFGGTGCASDSDCEFGAPVCTPFSACSDGGNFSDVGLGCADDLACDLGQCIDNQCALDSEIPCGVNEDCLLMCVETGKCANSLDNSALCETAADCEPLPLATCLGVGACNAREILVRFENAQTGDGNRGWLVYTTGELPVGTDFGDVNLVPRLALFFGFERDIDRDGLFERHELFFGSDDRKKDTDDDGLGDFAEIRVGWSVKVKGQPDLQVFPDPRLKDSDGDGVCDDIEMLCGTDPRKRDTDGDGIEDFDELNDDINGGDAEASECDSDQQMPNECPEWMPQGSDCRFAARCGDVPSGDHLDPLNPDTDGDGLLDGIELALGSDPLDPTDADAFLDTDEDGLTDEEEVNGWSVDVELCSNTCATAFNGSCQDGGACDFGTDCADCGLRNECNTRFSDPTIGDTDFDGLPDRVERDIGSDPTSSDTDGDGLLDHDEFADFGLFFPLNQQHVGFFLSDAGSQQIGTSPLSQDTDGDRLSDNFERLDGWIVTSFIGGQPVTSIDVQSDPLAADTDFDGSDDLGEFLGKDGEPPFDNADTGDATDPSNPDTDGDGQLDGDEIDSDPLVPDLIVEVLVTTTSFTEGLVGWTVGVLGRLGGEVGTPFTILDSLDMRACFGLTGFDDFCDGAFPDTFDFYQGFDTSFDGLPVCGSIFETQMEAGDVLLIDVGVLLFCGLGQDGCSSAASIAIDFAGIISDPWQQVIFNGLDSPSSGFEPCESQLVIEIRRK